MGKKWLSRAFRFMAEARQDRIERYRDYAKESRALDKFSTDKLKNTIDRNAFIMLDDVRHIYTRLIARMPYRLSDLDYDSYVAPALQKVVWAAEQTHIPCHVALDEDIAAAGRIKAGDILDILEQFDLPDGDGPNAHEDVIVPETSTLDQGLLGAFQKMIDQNLPLRTPSIDVKHESRETERRLDIYRPLIEAVGLAAKYKARSREIEMGSIPTIGETRMERQTRKQRLSAAKTYRGVNMD